ncbi:GHMP kinases C terminal [Popillia japonica]|uniref:GHMP kinases C terminal n=1 Tax=Popillia japonica TaxID=7064 RepID=A0AAW1LVI7_POPJA
MVHGTVPPSAGLSSSSALVSAAALATAHAHKHRISKEKLANLCAECERYIGTQGGGMDQAIAFLATEGCAKAIDFSPLRCRDVVLPPGAVFVVAHSLAKLNKAATADYNCRVVECRLAAQIIAKKKGLDWINIKRLGELQIALNVDLGTLITIVKEILHEGPYSKDEVLKVLDVSAEELTKTSLTPNTTHIQEFKLRDRALHVFTGQLTKTSLTPNTTHIQEFKLRDRALHVFTESLRVEKFIEECKNAPASGDTSLQVLGRLMNESHDSLRDLYECSHPRLDRLVELSRELTFGARLTGAGWGGCAVALVPRANIDKYISTLQEKFYDGTSAEDLSKLVFSTSPNSGACIYYATN